MEVIVETDPQRIAEMRAGTASYQRDMDTLLAQWDDLLEAHPGQWVTCHEGQIFLARTLDALFDQLRTAGIEPGTVPREFLARDLPPLLL